LTVISNIYVTKAKFSLRTYFSVPLLNIQGKSAVPFYFFLTRKKRERDYNIYFGLSFYVYEVQNMLLNYEPLF
jgi:hypothetical protein